jgi:hypothetical protein
MNEALTENQTGLFDTEEIIEDRIDSVDLSSVEPELNLEDAEKAETLSPTLTDSDVSGSEEFSLEDITTYSVAEVNGRFDLFTGDGQSIGALILPEDASGFFAAVRQAETTGRGVWHAKGETHLYESVLFKNSDGGIEFHKYSKELTVKEDEEKELKDEERTEPEQASKMSPALIEGALTEQPMTSINSHGVEVAARSDSEEQNRSTEEHGTAERQAAIDSLMESVFKSAEVKTDIQAEVNFEVGAELLAEPAVEQSVEILEEHLPEPITEPIAEAAENSDVAISVDNTEATAATNIAVAATEIISAKPQSVEIVSEPEAVETVESPSPTVEEQQAIDIVETVAVEPLNTKDVFEVSEAVAADKPVEITVDTDASERSEVFEVIEEFDLIEEFDEIMPQVESAQTTSVEASEEIIAGDTASAEIVSAEAQSEFFAVNSESRTAMPTVEIAAFANLEQAVGLEPAKSEVTIEEAIEAPTEQNIFEIINASSLTENGIGIRQENLPENPQPEQPLPTQPSTPVQELPTFNESVEKPVELVDITPEQATALEQIPEQTSEQDLQAPEQEYIESIRQQIYTETGIRLVEENVQSRATDARIVTDTSANSAAAKRNRSYIYEQLRPSQISMAITNATPEDLNAAQTKQPAKQLARAA